MRGKLGVRFLVSLTRLALGKCTRPSEFLKSFRIESIFLLALFQFTYLSAYSQSAFGQQLQIPPPSSGESWEELLGVDESRNGDFRNSQNLNHYPLPRPLPPPPLTAVLVDDQGNVKVVSLKRDDWKLSKIPILDNSPAKTYQDFAEISEEALRQPTFAVKVLPFAWNDENFIHIPSGPIDDEQRAALAELSETDREWFLLKRFILLHSMARIIGTGFLPFGVVRSSLGWLWTWVPKKEVLKRMGMKVAHPFRYLKGEYCDTPGCGNLDSESKMNLERLAKTSDTPEQRNRLLQQMHDEARVLLMMIDNYLWKTPLKTTERGFGVAFGIQAQAGFGFRSNTPTGVGIKDWYAQKRSLSSSSIGSVGSSPSAGVRGCGGVCSLGIKVTFSRTRKRIIFELARQVETHKQGTLVNAGVFVRPYLFSQEPAGASNLQSRSLVSGVVRYPPGPPLLGYTFEMADRVWSSAGLLFAAGFPGDLGTSGDFTNEIKSTASRVLMVSPYPVDIIDRGWNALRPARFWGVRMAQKFGLAFTPSSAEAAELRARLRVQTSEKSSWFGNGNVGGCHLAI